MSDKKRESGEIEITSQMLEAGAEVLFSSFGDVLPYGSSLGTHVAGEVYAAMVRLSPERNSGPSRKS
jgi:hypothetical protein